MNVRPETIRFLEENIENKSPLMSILTMSFLSLTAKAKADTRNISSSIIHYSEISVPPCSLPHYLQQPRQESSLMLIEKWMVKEKCGVVYVCIRIHTITVEYYSFTRLKKRKSCHLQQHHQKMNSQIQNRQLVVRGRQWVRR